MQLASLASTAAQSVAADGWHPTRHSDTLTVPTHGMLDAMRNASLGDAVYEVYTRHRALPSQVNCHETADMAVS